MQFSQRECIPVTGVMVITITNLIKSFVMKYDSKSKAGSEGRVQNQIKTAKGLVKAGGGYTNWNLTRAPLLNYIFLGKKPAGTPTNDHPSRKMLPLALN